MNHCIKNKIEITVTQSVLLFFKLYKKFITVLLYFRFLRVESLPATLIAERTQLVLHNRDPLRGNTVQRLKD